MPDPATLVPLLLGIERQVGELSGNIDGVMREMNRMGATLQAHVENDVEAHRIQDQRFVLEVKLLSERIAVIEQSRLKEEGARNARQRFIEWTRVLFAGVVGSIATWALGHGR